MMLLRPHERPRASARAQDYVEVTENSNTILTNGPQQDQAKHSHHCTRDLLANAQVTITVTVASSMASSMISAGGPKLGFFVFLFINWRIGLFCSLCIFFVIAIAIVMLVPAVEAMMIMIALIFAPHQLACGPGATISRTAIGIFTESADLVAAAPVFKVDHRSVDTGHTRGLKELWDVDRALRNNSWDLVGLGRIGPLAVHVAPMVASMVQQPLCAQDDQAQREQHS